MSDSHDNQNQRQAVALFRYGLIADLLHLEPGQRGLFARLRDKAEREYDIPGTLRRHVAVETLRDWLQAYRHGGFDALLPRPRADRGVVRALEQHVADQLCSLKEQQPALSVSMLIQHARAQGVVGQDTPLAHATVHRLLVRHGLMDKLTTKPTSNDRRHFAFQKANQLWMSDVMHGPAVMGESRRKQRSYLIALLDDATRVVPFAAFAASENVAAFQSVFEQALRRRGTPQRLYVDNGSAFRSHQLALVCAKLGVTLIHARPYQPQGKGKLERWFRTVRMRLLPFLSQHDTQSLDALNRRLWAWVEGEYHHTPHKGLDEQTPFDRWMLTCQDVVVPGAELEDIFLFEQKRKVHKDRTISLHGVLYEIDASLVGETVTLRYDPARPATTVQVHFKQRFVHNAKPVDAYANCFVRRDHSTKQLDPTAPPTRPPAGLRLRDLEQ